MATKRRGRKKSKGKGRKRAVKPSRSIFARASRPAPTMARKQWGEGVFTRVDAPHRRLPEGVEPDWSSLAKRRRGSVLGAVPPPLSQDERDDVARQDVFDELLRLDVDPSVARELANVDPKGWYAVVATVKGGSGRAGKDANVAKSYDDQNRVVLVGQGERLWSRFLNLCDPDGGGSELVDVEVHEMARPGDKDDAFPLWSGQTVTAASGESIEGSGNRRAWELSREPEKKRGRPKKAGGGMTAEERRAEKKRERERKRRKRKSSERVKALASAGKLGAANKLQQRRNRGVKSHPRKRKPGKGRTR